MYTLLSVDYTIFSMGYVHTGTPDIKILPIAPDWQIDMSDVSVRTRHLLHSLMANSNKHPHLVFSMYLSIVSARELHNRTKEIS